ncbi:hypothetical protein DSECCO2_503050 [anaerobic digester metagenome]
MNATEFKKKVSSAVNFLFFAEWAPSIPKGFSTSPIITLIPLAILCSRRISGASKRFSSAKFFMITGTFEKIVYPACDHLPPFTKAKPTYPGFHPVPAITRKFPSGLSSRILQNSRSRVFAISFTLSSRNACRLSHLRAILPRV